MIFYIKHDKGASLIIIFIGNPGVSMQEPSSQKPILTIYTLKDICGLS